MTQEVRVRFAPSPTGPLHIGGVRTALFNYLFAKKNGGTFILRIEDTDQNRYVPGAEAYIEKALNWCGIPYDEGPSKPGRKGPYRQSERKEMYRGYAEELVRGGHAYYAFDTTEVLDTARSEAEAKGETFIYNWTNRDTMDTSLHMSPEQVSQRLASGDPYVIRFKAPVNEMLKLQDIVRGAIEIDTNTLDDKVLFKSDGMPTYHLANIVDDHLMDITHVIRGEEWLPSLALHVLLYRAFGWEAPEFAHLPLILKPTGKGKLSKRDGDKLGFPVFPLEWKDPQTNNISSGYRESGYFPEAVVNFLALLGWNPGTEQEVFSLKELTATFDLERVHKSGARFDPEKIKWFNQQYLQEKNASDLILAVKKEVATLFGSEAGSHWSESQWLSFITLMKERSVFVRDMATLGSYFFKAPTSYDEKAVKKQWKENTKEYILDVAEVLNTSSDWSSAGLEATVKGWIAEQGLGFGQVMPPMRLALVGELSGPHVFDILELLGKKESVERLLSAALVLG